MIHDSRRRVVFRHRRPMFVLGVAAFVAASAGCGKAPPQAPPPTITIAAPPESKVQSTLTITASPDTNPDASGRASPVVVRVYQLKADGAFSTADFFALFDDPEKALGPELVTRDEFVLAPGERRTLDISVAKDARFVGVMAGFRDVRNAQWKAAVPAPGDKQSLLVSVERGRVVVSSTGAR